MNCQHERRSIHRHMTKVGQKRQKLARHLLKEAVDFDRLRILDDRNKAIAWDALIGAAKEGLKL